MKNNKMCKLWVDPEFKRFVKSKAAENDMSIIDYTRLMVNDESNFRRNNEKKKLKFFF